MSVGREGEGTHDGTPADATNQPGIKGGKGGKGNGQRRTVKKEKTDEQLSWRCLCTNNSPGIAFASLLLFFCAIIPRAYTVPHERFRIGFNKYVNLMTLGR